MIDRRIDLAVALAFVAFAIFLIVGASNIRLGLYRDPVGPRMFFYVCGSIMLLGGAYLAFRRLATWRETTGFMVPSEGATDEEGYPASAVRAFCVMGSALGYMLLLRPLGFLLAAPLFLMVGMFAMGQRNYRLMAVVAIGYTLFFYIVFAQLLHVRLPVGPFTNLFRELGWIIL